jgi:hypothetical protein
MPTETEVHINPVERIRLRHILRAALCARRELRARLRAYDRATEQLTQYKGGMRVVRVGDVAGVPVEFSGLVLALLPTGRTLVLVDTSKTAYNRDTGYLPLTQLAHPDTLMADEVMALVHGSLGHKLEAAK